MSTQRSTPNWMLPVVLGALVFGLVVVALLRGPVQLDPNTPEGTVQEYLVAVNEQRWDDAIEIIDEGWRGECHGSDLQSFASGEFTAELGHQDGFSRPLEELAVTGEKGGGPIDALPQGTTQVEVTIHHTDAGGLGSGWNESVVFALVEVDDFWWLTNDPWPHFIWSCRGD